MNPNGAGDFYNGIKLDDSLELLNRNPEKWAEKTAMEELRNHPELYPDLVN